MGKRKPKEPRRHGIRCCWFCPWASCWEGFSAVFWQGSSRQTSIFCALSRTLQKKPFILPLVGCAGWSFAGQRPCCSSDGCPLSGFPFRFCFFCEDALCPTVSQPWPLYPAVCCMPESSSAPPVCWLSQRSSCSVRRSSCGKPARNQHGRGDPEPASSGSSLRGTVSSLWGCGVQGAADALPDPAQGDRLEIQRMIHNI